jgi:hypothetical protein
VAHILLISMVESFYCVDLKMIQLGLILLMLGIVFFRPKNTILDRSDIIVSFVLVFLNIFYIFIDSRGLIFFKMTFILTLAILLSKIILPNISSKNYLKKIDSIYLIILIFLVIEYLILLFFGQNILIGLFNCNGEITGTRGYIPLYNLTKELLPFHITGLNSIMMGGQTASQLSIIIFFWFFYKYRDSENRKHLGLGLLAIIMLILSPSLTSVVLLLIALATIYLIYLKGFLNRPIKSFFWVYIVLFVTFISIYLIQELLAYRYVSLDNIYGEYVLPNLIGFGYFNFKEILFGISIERELELFGVGEIAFLNQLMKYGFLGVGVFYISIFYYVLRAIRLNSEGALTVNVVILFIFILGNIHYPVMFNSGVMELFILHLAYIIYQGSHFKK